MGSYDEELTDDQIAYAHQRAEATRRRWRKSQPGEIAPRQLPENRQVVDANELTNPGELLDALQDCVSLLRGDIGGAAQRDGILHEAERLLKQAGREG